MRFLRRGFSLIEAMVVLSILAFLVVAGVPAYTNYVANAQLREAANSIVSAGMVAQSEAIKINGIVRVYWAGQSLQVYKVIKNDEVLFKDFTIPDTVVMKSFSADYDSTGKLTPFGANVLVMIAHRNVACSENVRCPLVNLETGGVITICTESICR